MRKMCAFDWNVRLSSFNHLPIYVQFLWCSQYLLSIGRGCKWVVLDRIRYKTVPKGEVSEYERWMKKNIKRCACVKVREEDSEWMMSKSKAWKEVCVYFYLFYKEVRITVYHDVINANLISQNLKYSSICKIRKKREWKMLFFLKNWKL